MQRCIYMYFIYILYMYRYICIYNVFIYYLYIIFIHRLCNIARLVTLNSLAVKATVCRRMQAYADVCIRIHRLCNIARLVTLNSLAVSRADFPLQVSYVSVCQHIIRQRMRFRAQTFRSRYHTSACASISYVSVCRFARRLSFPGISIRIY